MGRLPQTDNRDILFCLMDGGDLFRKKKVCRICVCAVFLHVSISPDTTRQHWAAVLQKVSSRPEARKHYQVNTNPDLSRLIGQPHKGGDRIYTL